MRQINKASNRLLLEAGGDHIRDATRDILFTVHNFIMVVGHEIMYRDINFKLHYLCEIRQAFEAVGYFIVQQDSFFIDFHNPQEVWLPHFTQESIPEAGIKAIIHDGVQQPSQFQHRNHIAIPVHDRFLPILKSSKKHLNRCFGKNHAVMSIR